LPDGKALMLPLTPTLSPHGRGAALSTLSNPSPRRVEGKGEGRGRGIRGEGRDEGKQSQREF
jgi:hypothetical protein